MATSAEEPAQAVKIFNDIPGIGNADCMTGRYRTVQDRVICVVQKHKLEISSSVAKSQRKTKSGKVKGTEYVFEVKLTIVEISNQTGATVPHLPSAKLTP